MHLLVGWVVVYMYDKFHFNRSNSSSFIKKTKSFSSSKIITEVHKNKTFRLEKSHFFYIWIFIHPNDFIQHGIEQLLCDICAKSEVKVVSFFGFPFFPPRLTYALMGLNPEKMPAIWSVQSLFLSTNVLQYGPDVSGRYLVAWPIPSPDSNKFCCQISQSTSRAMFPSIKTRFPTPHDEKQPQHFTFPPPRDAPVRSDWVSFTSKYLIGWYKINSISTNLFQSIKTTWIWWHCHCKKAL